MVGQVDWFVSVWVWSVLVALDDFNCILWLEAKSFDVNCTQLKRRSYTVRFGSAILLPTHLKVPCVDYFRHIMSEPVSCGCVCVCVCAEGGRLRETDRERKTFQTFQTFFFTSWSEKWWHNNDLDRYNILYLCSILLMLRDLNFTGPRNQVLCPTNQRTVGCFV